MVRAGRAWDLRHAGRELKARRPARLFPAVARTAQRRPRLVVPGGLEECGFGVIDWRALPSRVTVELLRAADRIARDGHAVAFTGRPYRAGPELSIDGRPTVTRYLSGQPGPTATPDPAGEQLIATLAGLAGLAGSAHDIAVVSGQPEFSKQDATEAVTRWQHTQRSQRSGGGHGSVDVYGHDWALHL